MILWKWGLAAFALLFLLAPMYSMYAGCLLLLAVIATTVVVDWITGDIVVAVPIIYSFFVLYLVVGYVYRIADWTIRIRERSKPHSDDFDIQNQSFLTPQIPLTEDSPAPGLNFDERVPSETLREVLQQLTGVVRTFHKALPLPDLFSTWNEDCLSLIVGSAERVGTLGNPHVFLLRAVSVGETPFSDSKHLLRQASRSSTSLRTPEVFKKALQSNLDKDAVDTLSEVFKSIVGLSGRLAQGDTDSIKSQIAFFSLALKMYAAQHGLEASAEAFQKFAEAFARASTQPADQPSAACQLLEIHSGMTKAEIKAAYYRKVRQWHPDQLENMAPELRAFATEQLARINAAYAELQANG